jgi:hypothetical protein
MSFMIKKLNNQILVEFNLEGIRSSMVLDSILEVIPSLEAIRNGAR